jgi:EAL domain-containing protein (putative c-di-GMP-specific phosphodiesterase class I)
MEVVVEGVESEETFEMLREMGCDIAQGYGVSPPLSVDEFSGWFFSRTMNG